MMIQKPKFGLLYAGFVLLTGTISCTTLRQPPPTTSTAAETASATAEAYPTILLTSKQLRARVFLPDARTGYYRGSRFVAASVLGPVEHEGVRFFEQWLDQPHKPEVNDHVTGPADEFDPVSPSGFATARKGDEFLKIGVGVLLRDDDEPYRSTHDYPVAQPFPWTVAHGVDWMQCVQAGQLPRLQISYLYTQRIELKDDPARLILHREFKNTGQALIELEQYSHNFISINRRPLDRQVAIHWGFVPKFRDRPKRFDERVDASVAPWRYQRELNENQAAFARLEAPSLPDGAEMVRVCDESVPACVAISVSRPLSGVTFYARRLAICPEGFVTIRVAPGQTQTWSTTYVFSKR